MNSGGVTSKFNGRLGDYNGVELQYNRMSNSNNHFTPGCVVRARRRKRLTGRDADDGRAARSQDCSPSPQAATFACRATVATVNESAFMATILWDDMAPQPLPAMDNPTSRRKLKRPFLMAPLFGGNTSNSDQDSGDDQEEELPLSSLDALLPFECDDQQSPSLPPTPASLKEQGDALLRLKDYSAAVARYEAALAVTSSLDLGGTVIINDGTGRTVLAEVDCIDEEEGGTKCTADVTIVDSGDEKTVDASKDILLCLLENDEDRLQERILLNMSRCLIQLADIDGSTNNTRATKYRKAAVLGCTLALSCASYAGTGSDVNGGIGTESKARLIRAGAYLDLGKSKHATADAKRVLKADAGNAQAKKLLRNIERRDIQRKRTDKKLAKDVCKWVNTATNAATDGGSTPVSGDGGDNGHDQEEAGPQRSSETHSFFYNNLLFQIVFAVIVSIAVKLWLQAYEMLKQ